MGIYDDTSRYFGSGGETPVNRGGDIDINQIFDNIEKGVGSVGRIVETIRQPYNDSRRNNTYPTADMYGNPINPAYPYGGAAPQYNEPQYVGYGWGNAPYAPSYVAGQPNSSEGYPGIWNVNYGLSGGRR